MEIFHFFIKVQKIDWKKEFIDLFVHLVELEVLKYLQSFRSSSQRL